MSLKYKIATRVPVIALLAAIYLAAFHAVLHPQVSDAYRAYFIQGISNDWSPLRYPGSPQQGMELSRPGLPEWVTATRGFSQRELNGRWTDAQMPAAPSLTFRDPLAGDLCVRLKAEAMPWVAGQPIVVELGEQNAILTIAPVPFREYDLEFDHVQGAKTLTFRLPRKLPRVSRMFPGNTDVRRLGIKIMKLAITSGGCQTQS